MTDRIPRKFRSDILRRIGHGGEATVYELTGGRALRVYHGKPHGAADIAAFYRDIAAANTSFALPEILEQGGEDGLFYSLDRLIAGRPFHELMPHLTGDERVRALASYIDAAFEIASLPVVRVDFGEFLRDGDSIRADTWSAYLLARMRRSLDESPWLQADVESFASTIDELTRRIESLPPVTKSLVHGDYFPGNVLLLDDLTLSGVIDFGPLTVIGDEMLDVASAVMFLEVARPGYTSEDTEFCTALVAAGTGADFAHKLTLYRGWYAIRFSPYRTDDPNLYEWCVESLKKVAAELG